MRLPTVVLNGRIRGLRWFLWTPWDWRIWRRPRIERIGFQEWRWRLGPFDGKYRR